MQQKKFKVTEVFKESVTEILKTKKYSAVYPYMTMINREEMIYTEDELNSFISLLSEFSYSEVAEFFATIKTYRDWETDRKSTRLNSSHSRASRMPSSA